MKTYYNKTPTINMTPEEQREQLILSLADVFYAGVKTGKEIRNLEWSMYDETILKAIIDHFEYKKEFNEAEDYDIVLWLKSLKERIKL